MLRKNLVLLIGIIAGALILQVGIAFADLGYAGSDNYMTYYRDSSVPSTYSTPLSYASSSWNSCGGGVLIAGTTDNNSADLALYAFNNSADKRDGFYSVSWFGQDYISYNRAWADSYSADKKQSLIGHEFGHGWPLADQSTSTKALMNGSSSYRWDMYSIKVPQSLDVQNLANR